MAEITASMVKELRECTGAGMMECKKALSEAEGNLDAAVDILRTRGLAALAKKAGRATNEGTIAAFVSADSKVGVLVEVNSETDFVGRNAEFTGFAAELAEHIAAEAPDRRRAPADAGRSRPAASPSRSSSARRSPSSARTWASPASCARRSPAPAPWPPTSTAAARSACSSSFALRQGRDRREPDVQGVRQGRRDAGRRRRTVFVRREELAADVVEHELSIYKAQAAESGKPEAIQEKMAEGRLEKFFKEVAARRAGLREEPRHHRRAVRRRDRQGHRRHAQRRRLRALRSRRDRGRVALDTTDGASYTVLVYTRVGTDHVPARVLYSVSSAPLPRARQRTRQRGECTVSEDVPVPPRPAEALR